MSKIGSYALERMDDEDNTRYRDNMEARSYLVLWNPKGGRVKSKDASESYAVRATPYKHGKYSRT